METEALKSQPQVDVTMTADDDNDDEWGYYYHTSFL